MALSVGFNINPGPAPVAPSLYEYYTGNGIQQGLNANQSYFTLNNRNITIYSGAMHYFRVPKAYWRDRLRRMRAAGLNAVETYIPWNLHEYQQGRFEFGKGGSDFEDFLDVKEFLETAKSEDLFAIVRPGPFICSEWEFGGFPSWLLREKDIQFRTSHDSYMKYVKRYFNVLLPILAMLQFTKGGPIVAFQVENEYGSTERKGQFVPDKLYLWKLRQLMLDNGIVELLVSSDSPTGHGDKGTLPGVFLQTANFAGDPEREFDALKKLQSNKPTMAMEYWTGWFDHWSEVHHTRNDTDFYNVLERILKYPASVNMYMFHGGTSFGFMNGANVNNDKDDNSGYQPDTTSYDYDAPLNEAGDYTMKYVMVKELIARYNPIITRLPEAPAIKHKVAYAPVMIKNQLLLEELLPTLPHIASPKLLPMELLPINNGSGQSYGYIIYRTKLDLPADSVLKIAGHVCDSVIVMVDGILLSKPLLSPDDLNGFGYWRINNGKMSLPAQNLTNATLDLIVENWGRNNFGYLTQFNQFKGLWQGDVFVNEKKIDEWEIIPLEFKSQWSNSQLSGWHPVVDRWAPGPALYKVDIDISEAIDTFVDMSEWTKGIVIINGFVLGRYAKIGPQQTLYLPAPLLNVGKNTILVFEHFIPSTRIAFTAAPYYKTVLENKIGLI